MISTKKYSGDLIQVINLAKEIFSQRRERGEIPHAYGKNSSGFNVGQKVIYPNHGIGTIEQIVQKKIGSNSLPFYTLRLAATNSPVLVPVANASEVGLRTPISIGECEMLIKNLSDDFSSPTHDWKDRFKDFSEKMRTGDIFEVADVLKNLTFLSHLKPLSFREQRMLERARYLVISELAAVLRQPECNIEPYVEQALARACSKHERRPRRDESLKNQKVGH